MTGLYWDEDDNQEGLLTRRSPEHCLSEQEIEDFLFQRLSGVSREAVEEHLLICEDCRRRVEEEESFTEAMRGAVERLELEPVGGPEAGGDPKDAERAKRRFSPPRWALAASLAVVLLGGAITVRMLQSPGLTQVTLRAERSAVTGVEKAPLAGQPILLSADLRGLPPLPSLRWAVVDPAGSKVADGVVEREQEKARILLERGLPAGRYWVRIQDPETGLLLREYGLEVVKKR
jgi:hypothetical protein